MTRCASLLLRWALPCLGACAPALDWREVRLADSGLSVLFPCKPVGHARRVRLGPQSVQMELHTCTAAAATWAVACAELGDPARVGPALSELRETAAANLAASGLQPRELRIEGATPNPASHRAQWQGRLPDGRAVSGQSAVFARGTRVFQATVVGEAPGDEAMDNFFTSLRFVP